MELSWGKCQKKKTKIRSTKRQLLVLVNYMSTNTSFANAEYVRDDEGRENFNREWQRLRLLLADYGPDKSVLQWQITWRDLKRKARETDDKEHPSELTERIMKILRRMKPTDADGITSAGGSGVDVTALVKEGESIVFATVKQACVDLVKKHGHPITLIDEEAFRIIIQLMPMTMNEKAQITSEFIQKCLDAIETTGEEDEEDTSFQDTYDHDVSDNGDGTIAITIKGEIEEQNCSCDAQSAEGGSKGHRPGCPVAAKQHNQPYWEYFQMTSDEATCHICGLTFSWDNITKLKTHLIEEHPNAEFVDDGSGGPAAGAWPSEPEEIYLQNPFEGDPLPETSSKRETTSDQSKADELKDKTGAELKQEREGVAATKRKSTGGAFSGVWSNDDIEEAIHLTNPFDDPLPESSKRKRTSDQSKADELKDKTREELMRELKQEREGIAAAKRRVIELTPDRFKSLDIFGMYVAELMKLLPKKKCMKYQVQIVQRLLQEQAAAG